MNVGTLSSMFPDLIDNKFVFFCFEAKRNIYEKSGLLLICRKVITQNHSNRYLFLVPQFLSIILIVVKVYLKSYFFIHSFISVNLVYKCSFMTALKSRPAQWHARARWFSAQTHTTGCVYLNYIQNALTNLAKSSNWSHNFKILIK